MTPDERDLLDRFLSDLARARPGPKDAEAADRIERALRSNPDAAYVLVQHAILADQALAEAQARIETLERAAGPAPGQGSFLGGRGRDDGRYPPPPSGAYSAGAYPATSVPPTNGGTFGGGAPQPGPFSGGGGLGNFLRSAGTTAAGVAGGAFLFEGLSNMFGGHHGGGYGFGGFGGGPGVENVTINEYGDRGDFDDQGGGAAGFDEGPLSDGDTF